MTDNVSVAKRSKWRYALPADIKLKCKYKDHWKLKIHDKEEVEPPHVTIYGPGEKWRWDLRDKKFMDKEPPPRDVHKEIVKEVGERWVEISYEWNLIHADNPVDIDEDELLEFLKNKGPKAEDKLKEYKKLLSKYENK